MAPLVKEFQKHNDACQTLVCVSGQHREMLDQVLHLFDIKTDYDLDIMQIDQDLYDVTSRVLVKMRDVLRDTQPDIILVHGDTATSTAAAFAAFYQKIPVGHVEAGLRTHNIYSPWPEEMNRQLTGRLATYHFAPTETSRSNLLLENIPDKNIFVTGNTVIDALHWVINKINSDESLRRSLAREIGSVGYDLHRLANGRRLVLITGHRRENFGDGFLSICSAIKTLAEMYPDVDFVYPMHLNPNVRKPIYQVFENDTDTFDNLFFIEPLDYLPFVHLMSESYLVLTDSGGIQEEAPGLGIPVLVMRETTERPEAVSAGTVKLVGSCYQNIVEYVSMLLNDEGAYSKMSQSINPYGDGFASQRICTTLFNSFLNV